MLSQACPISRSEFDPVVSCCQPIPKRDWIRVRGQVHTVRVLGFVRNPSPPAPSYWALRWWYWRGDLAGKEANSPSKGLVDGRCRGQATRRSSSRILDAWAFVRYVREVRVTSCTGSQLISPEIRIRGQPMRPRMPRRFENCPDCGASSLESCPPRAGNRIHVMEEPRFRLLLCGCCALEERRFFTAK